MIEISGSGGPKHCSDLYKMNMEPQPWLLAPEMGMTPSRLTSTILPVLASFPENWKVAPGKQKKQVEKIKMRLLDKAYCR